MAGPGFRTPGSYTPLQTIAAAGLLANQGLKVDAQLTEFTNQYNALPFVTALQKAIALAEQSSGPQAINAANIEAMKKIGFATVPALGASVPVQFAGQNSLLPATPSGGFGKLIQTNAALYLGNGEIDKFCQAFQLIAGAQDQINELLVSAVNGTTFLGPTFTCMDDLITGSATQVTPALKCFGRDLANTGDLINLNKLQDFGTPTRLLQNISTAAQIPEGTLRCIQEILQQAGLTPEQIVALATPRASKLNLTESQFNALQKQAYQGMTIIEGACLEYVTTILGVTTDGLQNLAELLDIQKILPNSWPSLTVPTQDNTRVPIYNTDGSVNPQITQAISNTTLIVLPAGCDELAKIVPPDQAAASKAFQASLQQIGGITTTSAPKFAAALLA